MDMSWLFDSISHNVGWALGPRFLGFALSSLENGLALPKLYQWIPSCQQLTPPATSVLTRNGEGASECLDLNPKVPLVNPFSECCVWTLKLLSVSGTGATDPGSPQKLLPSSLSPFLDHLYFPYSKDNLLAWKLMKWRHFIYIHSQGQPGRGCLHFPNYWTPSGSKKQIWGTPVSAPTCKEPGNCHSHPDTKKSWTNWQIKEAENQ